MMILDTCSWLKIQSLKESRIFNLLPILHQTDLWATHELLKEYEHFLKEFLDMTKFSILSVDLTYVREFVGTPIDDADLSIIEFSRRNPYASVISDDGEALSICHLFNATSYQIADFCLALAAQSVITKREAYRIIKTLREWRNIDKKHHSKLSKQLQAIR